MITAYLHTIWCNTDNKDEHIWKTEGEAAPTVCPLNAEHSVNLQRRICIHQQDFSGIHQLGTVITSNALSTPPESPTDGLLYIIGASPTGDWSGRTNQIATWFKGAWLILPPSTGDLVYIANQAQHYKYNGTSWEVYRSAIGTGGIIQTNFIEITSLMSKSGSTYSPLISSTMTPTDTSSLFIIRFDASLTYSLATAAQIDFRLQAGLTNSLSTKRGTYAITDDIKAVSNASLTYKMPAVGAGQHTFTIQWRVRSGFLGSASINPTANTHEHASLLVQEIKG